MKKTYKEKPCSTCGLPFLPAGSANRFCSLACRIAPDVKKTDGCWEWTGSRQPTGYGQINWSGKTLLTHRVSYEINNGPIPAGMLVRHKCDNPPCCNPDHLELGSHHDNNIDCVNRGRHSRTGQKGEANPASRLTEAQVIAIRQSTDTQDEIAINYGVHVDTVKGIIARRSWRHI